MSENQTVEVSTEVLESPSQFKVSASKLFGQELGKTHEATIEFMELAENSAIPANLELTHVEKIKILNARRKAAARAVWNSELAETLGISKPGVLDTEAGQIATMAKVFRAMGNDDATALALATAAVAGGKK